jgi:hypothetical protein
MPNISGKLGVIVIVALLTCSPAWAQSASAAKSRVMQAQEYIDQGRTDDAKQKLDEAEKFLDGLPDDEKAPITKQIAALRDKLGAGKPAGNAASPSGTPTAAPTGGTDQGASDEAYRRVDRVLTMAEDDVTTNPDRAQNDIEQVTSTMDSDDVKKALTPAARAKLQARIEAMQAKVKSNGGSEAARRLTSRIESDLSSVNQMAGYDPRSASAQINHAKTLLASDDAQNLDAATVKRLEGKITDAEAALQNGIKKSALARATPPLKEFEDRTQTDPFKDVQPISAYKVTEEFRALRSRVVAEMQRIAKDDPDRKAFEDRLEAAQKKLDGYDAAFASANAEMGLTNRWKYLSEGFSGWDQEGTVRSRDPFAEPSLPKTEQAAMESKHFLDEKETVDASHKPEMKDAAAAIAEAQKTLADVQAKLDAAFNQWMDGAEKQPRPQGPTRFAIGSAADMARWADSRLAGTKYHDADVARAKKLDQKQFEETLAKMTADANDAWPKISSGIQTQEGFSPADVASARGKTFRFVKVRNRSGWDFDHQYDLVMWVDGKPVAGNFAPNIKKAFNEAPRQIGDSVDDHIDWEVIAIVQGRGSVNRRFTTEVKDEHQETFAKIEGTEPVDCVVVKVIAIHAGPIAMGPK